MGHFVLPGVAQVRGGAVDRCIRAAASIKTYSTVTVPIMFEWYSQINVYSPFFRGSTV